MDKVRKMSHGKWEGESFHKKKRPKPLQFDDKPHFVGFAPLLSAKLPSGKAQKINRFTAQVNGAYS